jgi:ADP-ribose pyrophosphatase YjhB (NUDIX family)
MTSSPNAHILGWAREIQALAQTGYHYANDDYQRERCQRLMAIAAEMISSSTGLEMAPIVKAFHRQVGYATPKIDVRAAVFRDGRLLMVRERMDGGWTMPGGWADVNDIPSQAAERETWEEAGFRVKARKVIGVYDANRMDPMEFFHAFKIVFLCDLIGGEARPSGETSEVAFFELQHMPSELSGERTKLRHITDAFTHMAKPNSPTFFD